MDSVRVVLPDDAALLLARGMLMDIDWYTDTAPVFTFTSPDGPVSEPDWDRDPDAVLILKFLACRELVQQALQLSQPSKQA